MTHNDNMQRGPGMKPMFLPEVEGNQSPSSYQTLIGDKQRAGQEYPQIWHLLAYLPKAGDYLSRFTQEIMRGPGDPGSGIRELIAAFTSYRNECPF